jgi:hypothetical protein
MTLTSMRVVEHGSIEFETQGRRAIVMAWQDARHEAASPTKPREFGTVAVQESTKFLAARCGEDHYSSPRCRQPQQDLSRLSGPAQCIRSQARSAPQCWQRWVCS